MIGKPRQTQQPAGHEFDRLGGSAQRSSQPRPCRANAFRQVCSVPNQPKPTRLPPALGDIRGGPTPPSKQPAAGTSTTAWAPLSVALRNAFPDRSDQREGRQNRRWIEQDAYEPGTSANPTNSNGGAGSRAAKRPNKHWLVSRASNGRRFGTGGYLCM